MNNTLDARRYLSNSELFRISSVFSPTMDGDIRRDSVSGEQSKQQVRWPRPVWQIRPEKAESASYRRSGELSAEALSSFVPKTELGKKLLEIRMRAIAKGMKLLTTDEILEEVRRRRGELEDEDADLR